MKNKVVIIAIAAFLMLLMACNPEPPVQYHKVNYIGADGNVMETHDVENGKADIPPQENPINVGYELIGWSLSKDGKSIYDFNTPVTSELTLYPVWKIESYKVTFICSEDVDNPPSEITLDYGSTIPPQNVTRTGYIFKGWSLSEDGSEPYDMSTPVTGAVTLYPIWGKTCTITYICDEDVVGAPKDITVDINTVVDAPEDPSKTGYTFKGWKTSLDSKDFFSFGSISSDFTLYPVWEINSYKVTFVYGEDVDFSSSEITVDHGSTIPPQDVTRTGYELKGWSTKEDGSKPYDLSTPVTGEIVLYPVFEIKKFTVTFVGGNGISSKHDSQTIEYNNTATAQNPTVKDGYTFLGWKEEGSEGYFDFNTKITTDITLHAVCESLKISVSFYDEKGDEILSSSGEYEWGKDNSFPSIDISKGFKLGWKKRGDSTTVYSTSFNLPYSDNEYIFDAYITSDLWQIDENGVLTKTKTDGTITSLIIPRSIEGITVTAIGTDAFRGFYNLTSVTIPNSVTTIGNLAFYYCGNLTSVTIPNSVTTIGNQAFCGCSNLTSITIPDSVETIGNLAFEGSSLTSITIPDNVKTIGSGAFQQCRGLTSITIGNGITTIGSNTFYLCSRLESITIPDNVRTIGYNAFYGCTSLTSITIPNKVTEIKDSTFKNCSNLRSVTIGSGVTTIGSYAFIDCTSLTSITIGSGITTIDSSAFSNCTSLTDIYVNKPENSITIKKPSEECTIHWNSTGPTT